LLGYAFALFLLLSGRYIEWILMLFPLWVLLISLYILIDNLRRPSAAGQCQLAVAAKLMVACRFHQRSYGDFEGVIFAR